ncbi:MAG TPA: hypothetical protein VNA69_10740 [Thermoanaerobaculia bacterium]|nr:hypothetical protein [Thermoanaerobaculia bacterium]
MTKRECQLLVLSPQARSEDQVQRFKPFGARSLAGIIRDVAAGLSHRKSLPYERHAVFPGFFFGVTAFDDPLIRDLRRVTSSLVDCGTYRSEEADAVAAAQKALSYSAEDAPDGAKWIVLTCGDGCGVEMTVPSERARSDEALFAHLWIDLCGGAFRRIGQVMARRWSD